MRATLYISESAQKDITNFQCDNAIVIKYLEKSYFITDGRYTFEAKNSVKENVFVIEAKEGLEKSARLLLRELGVKKALYDPSKWSVFKFDSLSKKLKNIKFIPILNLSQKERIIKNSNEIKALTKAVKVGERAFEKFVEFIKNEGIGLSEKELHYKAIDFFTSNGAHELSFSPIVAINENAAKPHALPTDLRLKEGDLLLIDAGVKVDGFCSDRTRTIAVGKNMNASKIQKFSNQKIQKVYDTVLKAQESAIKAVKPEVLAKQIDSAAREVIANAGYKDFFIHSTGHGVGRDIHELPVISKSSSSVLKEGMIFTVEPGIYLPNEFGIRIEDMLVVTKDGARVL